jgi:hypothetical protein
MAVKSKGPKNPKLQLQLAPQRAKLPGRRITPKALTACDCRAKRISRVA